MGRIEAICISGEKGTKKVPIVKAEVRADWGIVGDAHAGNWHRQISLLALESIEAFKQKGSRVEDGDFGENLVVSGISLDRLPIGTRMRCGEVLLQVTQIGKECHNHCAIYYAVGDCIMPRKGIFARVLSGGRIEAGNEIIIMEDTEECPYQAAVITLSDKSSQGLRPDASGPLLAELLTGAGYEVVETVLIADERETLKSELRNLADHRKVDLIITTGGTGFGVRDITPETTMEVAEKNAPGIAEAIRSYSMQITPHAMLSRGVSVIRGNTLIVNLPGSSKACKESIDCILGSLPHGLDLLRNTVTECAEIKRKEENMSEK